MRTAMLLLLLLGGCASSQSRSLEPPGEQPSLLVWQPLAATLTTEEMQGIATEAMTRSVNQEPFLMP
jgi:uncharacterized protein YcfL